MTEEQRKLQEDHADKIRARRVVREMTGLSDGQLRTMQRFQERNLARQQQRMSAKVDGQPRVMQTGEQNFYPKRIEEVVRSGDGGGGGAAIAPVGDIEDVIISFNGTLYYCTLNGTVGDAV